MDLLGILFLLGIGFVVGLSAALMPGPLLVYTINESLQRGKWTGALVMVGHAVVEVIIFILLMFGLTELISSELFIRTVSILGGLALILMAFYSLKNLKSEVKIQSKSVGHGVIVGGIIFTIFNPGFPIWWVTAGMRVLMEGLRSMGFLGMLLVFIGHWLADFGWFLLVSVTTSTSSKLLFKKGWYRKIRTLLSILLFIVGIYFLSTGI